MPRKILIVDDITANRLILSRMLRGEYDIIEAASGRQALDILSLESESVSAVLLDIVMPEMDGFEVLQNIRSNPSFALLPVIMITSSSDDKTRVKSLTLGANDFVMKPYSSEVINHCLRNNIAFSEAAATVNALQRDRLTGVYNRDAFFEKAAEMIKERPAGHYILGCVDIDNFKVINDQYGSETGDHVLKSMAGALQESCDRRGGICGRIYADCFASLFPRTLADSGSIGPHITEARIYEDTGLKPQLSVGRYIVDDKELGVSAMYDRAAIAKNSIKGLYDVHVAVFDESMRSHLVYEQGIANDMNAALAEQQFEVWFQPQYNHSTDAMIGAEALVRWRHPEKGLISPNEFIPIFEQNGFIYALDKYVWERVCRYLREWRDAGRSPLPVSVNISRYDVLCSDLIDVITGLVKKYELPVDLLRLEITESAFTESSQDVIRVVKEFINLGFTVEIDDFGSGYSSLNTLKDVPAQILKLDMKFLENSGDSERGGNIVESIVRMAKWLGMSVIAEGVETLAQADYLRSIGCSYMQGYLYAKPMPADSYLKHCDGSSKEERLLTLETVENLDNNSFWDPESMDTLIFNSYVGGACIYEYHNGNIELLRATEKYAQVIGSAGMTVEDALKLNWAEHFDGETRKRVVADLDESIKTGKEITGEYVFLDLPNCPRETHLRSTLRVIAAAGDRYLVYCTNENITAQRQAEKRELETDEQLKAILKNIDGGITATAVEKDRLRLLFANDRYFEHLGYTRAQYAAKSADSPSHILPGDRAMVMKRCLAISATGKPDTIEYRIERPDGAVRWLRSSITLMDYPGEAAPVQLAVTYDITERFEAQQEISRLSEQLQAIMDSVDLGIIATVVENGTARYLFTNNRYYEMLGYTKAQFDKKVGSPYLTVAKEDLRRVMDETARINVVGESATLVYNAVTKSGKKRVFRAYISIAALSGIDKPVQFSIIRDITEETETERRERLAAEQLQTMMDDTPGGFVRLSVDGDGCARPVYFNDGMLALTGMTRDELNGLYGNDVMAGVHPDDVAAVKESFARMLADGEAHSARYRLRRGTDGYAWVSTVGRRSTGLSGEVFLNIYYSDATEQIREEETQRALLDNLPGGAGLYEYDGGKLTVVYLNKSYWALIGSAPADYSDTSPMSALHPDDFEVVAKELASAVEQKRDMSCDIRLQHDDGGYINVHLAGKVIPKAKGGYTIYTAFIPILDKTVSYQQLLPLLLSAIMDSTTDLSFSKDADFRYITASRAFANMVGQNSPDDVIGKTDYDLFDKALADKFRRDDEELLKNGKSIIDMVEPIPSPDGTPRYSSTSKYILRDGSGEIIGLYGTGRDITRAVAQDSQLRLVNDSIPGGLVTYAYENGSLHIVYCNDGFCELFGGTREGFERRADLNPMDWVLEKDRPELSSQIEALVQKGRPMDCVFRINVIAGGYKWVNIKAVATERRGDAVLFNAVLLNITERQNALEQLRISEEENNLAVALGGSVIMRYIVADRSLSIAPEVAKALSLPERIEDVPYEPVRRGLISPESAEAYTGFFEAIIKGSEAGTVIYQQQFIGDWRWMEAKSSTVFSDDGKPVKAVISLLDVTERLEKETIYRKWQQSLEDRPPESYTLYRCNLNNVAADSSSDGTLLRFDFNRSAGDFNARTKEYVRQCVFESDRDKYLAFVNSDAMLASYYRGKRSDTLEYRELTPGGERWLRLTVDLVESPNSTDVEAYLMYEDIDEIKREELQAKERSETDPLTGVLNRAVFAAKVEQIIRASRPEKRHALLMLDIDGFKQVNDVFGHGAGDQTLMELAHGLRSMLRRDDLVARLGGDEFMVFLNDVLDDNSAALKAKQMCALARKSFSLEVQISGSVGIALSPHDGMDFDTLYKKADAALYYVKGSGKDSFAFYNDDMENEHLTPEADAVRGSAAPKTEKKRRMLIVDDNNLDFALLQNIFRDDFIIEKAKDGSSALIRLRHYGSAISVVLLDLMMPGMDGFAVLEKMQSAPELRSIPVIIVSGDESRETCLKAIRKGATDFVTKPVDADILKIRAHSAVSKAENERLRAKNCLLEVQNDERVRYESALENIGVTFIDYNWLSGVFSYYPSVSSYLLGTYDNRPLWQILLSDLAADTRTVQDMQQLVHRVAEDRELTNASLTVRLKTPKKELHTFRMTVHKLTNEYQLTNRLIIALNDLDYKG